MSENDQYQLNSYLVYHSTSVVITRQHPSFHTVALDILTFANQECNRVRCLCSWFPSPALFLPELSQFYLFLFSTHGFPSTLCLPLLLLSISVITVYIFSFTSSLKKLHQSAFSHLLLLFLTLMFCFFVFLLPMICGGLWLATVNEYFLPDLVQQINYS